jgi:hypothetical protein
MCSAIRLYTLNSAALSLGNAFSSTSASFSCCFWSGAAAAVGWPCLCTPLASISWKASCALMLSESLAGGVDSVRLWQLGRMEVGVVVVDSDVVGNILPSPRFRKQMEEDENARRVEDCASIR